MSHDKKRASPIHLLLLLLALVWHPNPARAATNQFRGVNWADPRDNFQSGIVLPTGLTSSDTASSASAVAAAVMDQFISKLGANAVRLPVNEATISNFWSAYSGVIDTIASKGTALLCYWHPGHGVKIPNMNKFWAMWKTLVDKYGANSSVYFEVQNEPNMYSATELRDLYANFLTKYPDVPKSRIVLDGTGMSTGLGDIAGDTRFDDCLLAVHEYTMWGNEQMNTEAQWTTHFKGLVTPSGKDYSARTVCTEWGNPMSPGSKNGVQYDTLNYGVTGTNWFTAYMRAITSLMRTWQMGSFYWAGLKDGDWYSMTKKSGTGAGITLSVPNQSGLERMQYSWTSSGGTVGTDGGVPTGGAGGSAGGAKDAGADVGGLGGTTGSIGTGGRGGAGRGGDSSGGGVIANSSTSSAVMGGSLSSGPTASGGSSAVSSATGAAGSGGQSSSSSASLMGGATSGAGGSSAREPSSSANPVVGGGGGQSSLTSSSVAGATSMGSGSAGHSDPSGCSCDVGRSPRNHRVFGLLLCLLVWHRSRRRQRG